LEEHQEAERPKWRVGASGLYTSTTLRFSDDVHGDETRNAVLASVAYHPTRSFAIHAGVGAAFAGQLTMPDGVYDFSPGPTAVAGASWRVLEARPFLILTSQLSFTAARTHRVGTEEPTTGYEAFDLRLGGLFGTTLFDLVSPYAAARVFGGPVFWHYQNGAVTGTDLYHYQVGAGVAVLVASRVDVYAEAIPLGERALSAGLDVAF